MEQAVEATWGLLEACVSGYRLHSDTVAATPPGAEESGGATVGGRRPAVRWYDARCTLLEHVGPNVRPL